MMKRKLLGLVVIGLMLGFVSAAPSYAAVVAVGDLVKLESNVNRDPSFDGGAFDVYKGSKLFATFCLEGNETVSFNVNYKVSDISLNVWIGGGSSPTTNPDPLSYMTQYLYSKYINGGFGPDSTSLQRDIQEAIWKIENETGGVANSYYDEALLAENKDYFVRAMNLVTATTQPENYYNNLKDSEGNYIYQRQSVLIYVPEPGTLLLLGSGLLGLAIASSRKKFRK